MKKEYDEIVFFTNENTAGIVRWEMEIQAIQEQDMTHLEGRGTD